MNDDKVIGREALERARCKKYEVPFDGLDAIDRQRGFARFKARSWRAMEEAQALKRAQRKAKKKPKE
jgi:hypothetical protein